MMKEIEIESERIIQTSIRKGKGERERIEKKKKKFSTCACVFLFSRALSKVIPRYCSRDGWTGGTIVLLSPLF